MLGRCPRPFLHRTTSKGELHAQSHEIAHLPSSEDEKPVLQPPHQIVIGFDLGAESSRSLHSQAACESPRSVLEPHHLCFHQQSRSPHSPLSALGSLLSDRPRLSPRAEGAALCLKVAIKAEEGVVGANVYNAFSGSKHVACDVDGAGASHACLKRDHMACDVVRGNVSVKSVPRTDYAGARQNQPWNHGPTEHAGVRQNQPWNYGPSDYCGSRANPHTKAFLSSDCEDEESDDDDDADGVNKWVSMFSTSSPVLHYSRHDSLAMDFLSKCFLCRRHLLQGKDIYMYRGYQAFCSQECRHQQIVVDERKERCPAVVACVSGAATHHKRMGRATQAAFT